MIILFRLILRLVALALSYALSTFVAAAFLTFVLFLGSDASWVSEDPLVAGGAIVFAGSVWHSIGAQAAAPTALLFLGMELARLKSLVWNVLAGGACAAVVLAIAEKAETGREALPYSSQEVWLAALASGFVGGLVHWVLAGHRAGNWMGRKRSFEETISPQ